MKGRGLSLDKAGLLSVVMEGTLYGFSLLMFGGTIWAVLSRRSTHGVDCRVLPVACLLLMFSTTHFVIDIIRVIDGFVLYRDTFPEGPMGYFSDVSQWTFVYMNYVFTAQTLLGDSVILYRCYAVWQSKRVMIMPVLLWCAAGVTGIGWPSTALHVTQDGVFDGSLSQWITSWWACAFATNLLTTVLLASRIWWVDRKAARIHGPGKSQLRPMLRIIVDAGGIYSLTLLVVMICFLCRSNFQYVLLPMVTPIISITFYMVIIRVELANRAKTIPFASTETSFNSDRRCRMQVRITTLTESKIEEGFETEQKWDENKVNDVGMAV